MNTPTEPNAASQHDHSRRFRTRFLNRDRVFLLVIYAADEKQTLQNVDTAREADADGVFLINHGIGHQRLLRIAKQVVGFHPDLCVGVNCLDLRPQDVICRLPDGVEGVWGNNPLALEAMQDTAVAIRQARQLTGWDGMFFADVAAGVGIDEACTPAELARAIAHIDVLTIVARGSAQRDLETLRELRQTLNGQALGIAGDVSPDGVEALLRYTHCVLTTARADSSLEHMDLQEAKRLAERIHAFREERVATD
jgi:hypothetical protein